MRKLSLYTDFICENILNESVIFYVSDFRQILQKLASVSPVAQELLKKELNDNKADKTFISISDMDGYVKFTTMRNVKVNVQKNGTDSHLKLLDIVNLSFNSFGGAGLIDEIDGFIPDKTKNSIKLGRLVNTLLPGKFKDKEIEEFTNLFKSKLNFKGGFYLVKGEDIAHWYKSENYAQLTGQLGNSCMRKSPSSYFQIYIENPEVCQMLILLNEDEKLIGRALIWKPTEIISTLFAVELPNDLHFMDRIYTIEDSDVLRFRTYATDNGWAYKTYNNFNSNEQITYKDKSFTAEMDVKITSKGYVHFPYMDTFKRYNPYASILHNHIDSETGHYLLNQTDGLFEEIEEEEDLTWSEWEHDNIPSDEAVWCENVHSFIYSDRVREVNLGERTGIWPEGHPDIVYSSEYDDYIHSDESTWVDNSNTYILYEDMTEAIIDMDEDGYFSTESFYRKDPVLVLLSSINKYWVKRIQEVRNHDVDFISRDLLIGDSDDNLILKEFVITVYHTNDKRFKYLEKTDAAVLLGVEINLKTPIQMDSFDYHLQLEKHITELDEAISLKIKQLENKLQGTGQLELQLDDIEPKDLARKQMNLLHLLRKRSDEINLGLFIDQP